MGGGRGSGAAGATISSDDDNGTKLLLFISPLPQIVLDERNLSGGLFDYAQSDIIVRRTLDRNPFGGLAPERARLENHIFYLIVFQSASRNDIF